MYMNLHALPAGQAMYTMYIAPKGTPLEQVEEHDQVAPATAPQFAYRTSVVILAAKDYLLDAYGPEVMLYGLVNQSEGTILYDSRVQGYRPIPVVPPARLAEMFRPQDYNGRLTVPYDAFIDLCGDAADGMGTEQYLDYLMGA